MKLAQEGYVARAADQETGTSLAFPGICVLPGGRWIATFRIAPKKTPLAGQDVCITWSDDYGRTWSKPGRPFIPPQLDGRKGTFRTGYLTAMPDGSVLAVLTWVEDPGTGVPYFNEETEGLLDSQVFLACSSDRGQTWSDPQAAVIQGFPVPIPTTGPLLALDHGALACQFEVNKPYYDTSPWHHASVIALSGDGGKTWPDHRIISRDPENRIFYWDQRISQCRDKRLLDLFWTYDRQDARYLSIHARESLDCGRNWSEIWDTEVPGQPAAPVFVQGDRICMVYVDRTASPMIKARLSSDLGRTWPPETEITLYTSAGRSQETHKESMQDAWAEMGKFSVGLPATARAADGDVLAVFYEGPETDITNIRWVRIRI